MRGIFATVGAYMLVDAVISHVVRPGIQAGRFLRGGIGIGLGALAIAWE